MIVINSMKGKGVTDREQIKHYAKTSVLFAGIGLVAIYLPDEDRRGLRSDR